MYTDTYTDTYISKLYTCDSHKIDDLHGEDIIEDIVKIALKSYFFLQRSL